MTQIGVSLLKSQKKRLYFRVQTLSKTQENAPRSDFFDWGKGEKKAIKELLLATENLETQVETLQSELNEAKSATVRLTTEIESLKPQLATREQEAKSLLERALLAEQALQNRNKEFEETFKEYKALLSRAISAEKELEFLNKSGAKKGS